MSGQESMSPEDMVDATTSPVSTSSPEPRTRGDIHAAIAALSPPEPDREHFISTRWPHTYAYDFARQHPALIGLPEGHEACGSRSQMSGEVKAYAERTGQDLTEVKQALASEYLTWWDVAIDPAVRAALTPAPTTIDEAGSAEEERRLVVVLNSDVTMTRGKRSAQAVHAALALLGVHPGTPVIVLGGKRADIEAMPVQIRDAGRTEVDPGTLTAGAEWRTAPPQQQGPGQQEPPAEGRYCAATVPGTAHWRCMLPEHDDSVQHDDGRGKRWGLGGA